MLSYCTEIFCFTQLRYPQEGGKNVNFCTNIRFSTVMVFIRPSPDSRSLVMVAVKYVFCMSKRSLIFC